jgi:hypothetical protein
MATDFRARTQAATVWLPKLRGQAVLVPGGCILTAAHCVEWSGDGAMVLGDYFLETVVTQDGRKFRASVCAVEPVADVAALAAADCQTFWDDFNAFERFAAGVRPVPLFTQALEPRKPVTVEVLTHKGKWLTGTAVRHDIPGPLPCGSLWLELASRTEAGTSGGPVVDKAGRLLGLVSNCPECDHGLGYPSLMPAPYLALPRWLSDRILAAHARPRRVKQKDPGP